MASPTPESAKAADCTWSSCPALASSSSHPSLSMKSTRSLNSGAGVAHVQCAGGFRRRSSDT